MFPGAAKRLNPSASETGEEGPPAAAHGTVLEVGGPRGELACEPLCERALARLPAAQAVR